MRANRTNPVVEMTYDDLSFLSIREALDCGSDVIISLPSQKAKLLFQILMDLNDARESTRRIGLLAHIVGLFRVGWMRLTAPKLLEVTRIWEIERPLIVMGPPTDEFHDIVLYCSNNYIDV